MRPNNLESGFVQINIVTNLRKNATTFPHGFLQTLHLETAWLNLPNLQKCMKNCNISRTNKLCTVIFKFTFNPIITTLIHPLCLSPNKIFFCSLRKKTTALCMAHEAEILAAHEKECKMGMSSIQVIQQSAAASQKCFSRRHSWDQHVSKSMRQRYENSSFESY